MESARNIGLAEVHNQFDVAACKTRVVSSQLRRGHSEQPEGNLRFEVERGE